MKWNGLAPAMMPDGTFDALERRFAHMWQYQCDGNQDTGTEEDFWCAA